VPPVDLTSLRHDPLLGPWTETQTYAAHRQGDHELRRRSNSIDDVRPFAGATRVMLSPSSPMDWRAASALATRPGASSPDVSAWNIGSDAVFGNEWILSNVNDAGLEEIDPSAIASSGRRAVGPSGRRGAGSSEVRWR
jgi:hypothetical protein